MDAIEIDRALIKRLGGPAKLAELLRFDKEAGGVQRVHNWLTRGIPSKVKVDRPDLFLKPRETGSGVTELAGTEVVEQGASNAG